MFNGKNYERQMLKDFGANFVPFIRTVTTLTLKERSQMRGKQIRIQKSKCNFLSALC
jgi:hypothetical protein